MSEIQVQSLVLCRCMLQDKRTNAFSAIGIFDRVGAVSYESPLVIQLTAMAMYQGGRMGEELVLRVMGSDPTAQPICQFRMVIDKPDPVDTSFFHVELSGFPVLAPGTLFFELHSKFAGVETHLKTARLTATLLTAPPAAGC